MPYKGPNFLKMTSLKSTQPLKDSTSNKANMEDPKLSKLNLRGFIHTLGTYNPGFGHPSRALRFILVTKTSARNIPVQFSLEIDWI